MSQECPCEDDIASKNPERVDPEYVDPGNEVIDDKIKILPLMGRIDAIHDGLTLISVQFRGLRQVLDTDDWSRPPHEPGISSSSTQIGHTSCKQKKRAHSRCDKKVDRNPPTSV